MPKTVWGFYAARVYDLEQRNGHRIHDRKRFEETVAVDGIRRLSELANRWWQEWDLTPARLAECLIDGNVRYANRRTT